MFSSKPKRTLIVCICLAAMTLCTTIVAETIGQKVWRLRLEQKGVRPSQATGDIAYGSSDDSASDPEIGTSYTESTTVRNSEPKYTAVPASDPLGLVPANSMVCVRINNFGKSVMDLDKYLAGLSPVPLATMVQGQLGTILGDPLLSGVDLSGDAILFANFGPAMDEPTVALMIPLTSYDEFTKNNPNCSAPDGDGISTIAPKQSMFGKFVTAKAGSGKHAYLAQENNKETLLDAISAVKSSSLAAGLTANEQKLSKTSPVWVYGNLEQAVAAFKPMINESLKSIPKQKGGPDFAALLTDGIDQMKSLSLTLTPTPQKLSLGVSISAKPGSKIAKTLVADPAAKPGFELAGYLSDEAAMNVAAKINKPMLEKMIGFVFSLIPEKLPLPFDVKEMVAKGLEVTGDQMAYSISKSDGPNPFAIKQLTLTTDPSKAVKLYEDQIRKMKEMPGPKLVEAAEPVEYNGTDIYSMKLTTPAGPGSEPQTMIMNMAVAGNIMISCQGDMSGIKAIIDQTKSNAPRPSGDMAKALSLVDGSEKMDVVASLNLIRMAGIGGKAAMGVPVPQAKMAAGMLGGLKADSKSCMAVAGKIDGGRIDAAVVLPKDHLMEVFGAVMQMQQKMMKDMTPEMMEGGTMPMEGGSFEIEMSDDDDDSFFIDEK